MCRELDCLSVWGLGETVFCLTKDRRLFWCTEEDWGTKDCLPWKELPIFPPEGYRVGEERDGVKGGGRWKEEECEEKSMDRDLVRLVEDIRYVRDILCGGDAKIALDVVRTLRGIK